MARDDHTGGAQPALRLRRRLPAPREKVFAALSRAEALRRWMCPQGFTCTAADADLRVGGRYRVTMRSPEGQIYRVGGVYREIRPPDRLVFTLEWEPENEFAGVETVVVIELEKKGGETELIMTHTGLPSENARERHAHGWNGAFDHLVQLLQQPQSEEAKP